MTSPYLAAINYIFASPRETCDNCGKQDAAGQLASDTSPITPLLLDYLERTDNNLETLEPENVRPFLIKNLRWRVVYVSPHKPELRLPHMKLLTIRHSSARKTRIHAPFLSSISASVRRSTRTTGRMSTMRTMLTLWRRSSRTRVPRPEHMLPLSRNWRLFHRICALLFDSR